MKGRDKQTPEVPAADTFHSLPQFPAKPTGSPHAGDPYSKVTLHQKAEAQVREREERSLEELAELSPKFLKRILHELRVHQIELEMQNEELRRVQAALEAERARYFHIFDLAPVGYVTLNAEGLIVEANLTAANLLGMARRELTGKTLSNFILREDRDLHYHLRKRLADSGATQTCEVRMGKTAGTAFWAHLSATAVQDPDDGSVCRVVLSDISELNQVMEALRESEMQFRATFEQAAVGVGHVGLEGQWLRVNRKLCNIVGYSPEELLQLTFQDITHPDDLGADLNYVRQLLAGEIQTYTMEKRYIRKDAAQVWINLTVSLVCEADGQPKYFISVVEDISERKRADANLHLALTEKTALVMEIHHRVKNNLAIMISLINLQARHINHRNALAALTDTKARLFSMSLLHEMLYSAGRMDQVEIQSYLQRLCGHLSRSHGLPARGIQIQNSPSAPLTVGIDQAVPCGLIVNELVSNTIKHAFPDDRQGKVTVDLALAPPDILTLRVTDDGIGLQDGLQSDQTHTLGLSLVDALTHQLRGTLEIQRGPGTTFVICFPLEPTTPV